MDKLREFFGSILLVPVFIAIFIWEKIRGVKNPGDFS